MFVFDTQFQQLRYLYESAIDAWIGGNAYDESELDEHRIQMRQQWNTQGHLYIEFSDNSVIDCGIVTAYGDASSDFPDGTQNPNKYTGTHNDFATDLGQTATNADKARQYAQACRDAYNQLQYYIKYNQSQLNQLNDQQRKTARDNMNAAQNVVVPQQYIDDFMRNDYTPIMNVVGDVLQFSSHINYDDASSTAQII